MKQIKYIFLLSILFFACDEINPVNTRDNFTFLCVLKNDQVTQRAYIYDVIDLDGTNMNSGGAFVDYARITISDGTISSRLRVDNYVYTDNSALHGRILPNKKYDVQIIIDDEIITGSTTTPGEFAINLPINNTIDIDKDADKENIGSSLIYKYRLSWSESANASHYMVFSDVIYRHESGRTGGFRQTINTADTFALLNIPEIIPESYFDFTGYYPELAKFVIISVDKNYYDYNILKRDRAGISSGYGVFGSSITIADSCFVCIK
jgi:hypothetical protein